MKIGSLVASGINVLGDVGFGLIVMHVARMVFGLDIPFWYYFFAAFPFIGFSCLPDMDALYQKFIAKKELDESHRIITHDPKFMIPVVCAIVASVSFLVGAHIAFWVSNAFFSLLVHFLRDSIGADVDFGIRWWGRPKKFFTRQNKKFHWVYSFSEKEMVPTDIDTWAEKYYVIRGVFPKPTLQVAASLFPFILGLLMFLIWA